MSVLELARKPAAKPKLPKLLACPFCGSRAQLQTHKEGKSKLRNGFWRGSVRCTNNACGISTPIIRAPEAAVHVWNRRAAPERITPRETSGLTTE